MRILNIAEKSADNKRTNPDRRGEDVDGLAVDRRRRPERRLPILEEDRVSFAEWARAMVIYLGKIRRAKIRVLTERVSKE
jgi:hypothetical protein